MIKKIMLAGALYVGCANMSYAGSYAGGSVGFLDQGAPMPAVSGFVGYGQRMERYKRLYLGAELNVTSYFRFDWGNSVSASLLPGVMLTDNTMLYARLGAGIGGYVTQDYRGKHNAHFNPFLSYGLGLQTKLTEHWDIRGEYTPVQTNRAGIYTVGLVYKFD